MNKLIKRIILGILSIAILAAAFMSFLYIESLPTSTSNAEDVINTYLLYLIYQHHNGSLSKENFTKCKKDLHEFLIKKSSEKQHFVEYLEHWDFK